MAKIKICGLSRTIDIDIVNEALPDYIGFVFAKSRRQVNEETARELKKKLNPTIYVVGVFVNDDIQRIIHLCREEIIDIIQLHGDEDENYTKILREAVPNQIIKAVRVKDEEDIKVAGSLNCDYLLLDAYKEDQYGGCGETFDWTIITGMPKQYFLAGGINNNNVMKAIQLSDPYCIDVSSGVETDGWKDRSKVCDIVAKVRKASQNNKYGN